jgi:putative hydrolase of the HAD superfamily
LFLLSNTNAIHYREFQERFLQQTNKRLDDLFEKTYYSHAINLRKPDVACYQYVIADNLLSPSETLFIDDSETNLEGARRAGLATAHMRPGFTIEDIEW